MKCPNCDEQLAPWCWLDDGSYKGIICINCGSRWHSAKLSQKIQNLVNAATHKIEVEILSQSEFPEDAITPEQFDELLDDDKAYCEYFGFDESDGLDSFSNDMKPNNT